MTKQQQRQDAPLREPKPPFPAQHQDGVGLEKKLSPRPKYEAEAYRPAGKLEGKAALITGGDSGIGRAVAVLFAREGADVAITYLPQEQPDADETRQAIEQCSCSIDVVASLIPFDRFVTAETVLSMAQVRGTLGSQFRTSEQASSALNDLRRAQAEAEVRCF